MPEMNLSSLPAARSPKLLQRQMISSNRFLGIHQFMLGALLSPAAVWGMEAVLERSWQWWWVLPAIGAAWGLVELLFLPRRLAIHRLAVKESRDEVAFLALKHHVALQEIRLTDRESNGEPK
ncbi:hypothetical protein BCL93_11567 [Onishia taeanensis]|uniref:Uncharacterized protein n=1 Tax=Onishia taeanensis TaxID=284577 RepID=A0A328XNM9_9GAMM|nr:hypothetical protein BCL93_11567 [Halomonas taeanensis]